MKETCVGLAKIADVPFLVFFVPFEPKNCKKMTENPSKRKNGHYEK